MNAWIIIPAHNEEATIGRIVGQSIQFGTVVVINDSSTDHTAAIAARSGAQVLENQIRRGYDQALALGYERALEGGASIIVTMDADGEIEPALVKEVIEPIASGRAKVCLGVRDKLPRWSERLCGMLARWCFGVPDILCGLKGFDAELCRAHPRAMRRNMINMRLAWVALRAGLPSALVPVAVRSRKGNSRMGNSLKANLVIMSALLKMLIVDHVPQRTK